MLTRRCIAVLDLPLSYNSSDGFAPRALHFVAALADALQPFEVIALCKDPAAKSAEFIPEEIEAQVSVVDVGTNPLIASGIRGRWRRLKHYLMPLRLPGAYPRRLAALTAIAEEEHTSLVVFFLPRLAHLGQQLPDPVKRVYVLDEGFERSAHLVANDSSPKWKVQWNQWAEHVAARQLYRAIAKQRALVIAISENEKRYFERYIDGSQIAVVPHGIDCEYFCPSDDGSADFDIIACGVLSQPRNYQPIAALLSAVALRTVEHASKPRWVLVGKDPHPSLREFETDDITIAANVEDVRPYYRRSRIAVVPAFGGGGVKTTVLQAWAMQRAVIATRHSVAGLPAHHMRNVLVADTVAELADHVLRLLNDRPLRERLAVAGRQTVERERNIKGCAKRFGDAVLKFYFGA